MTDIHDIVSFSIKGEKTLGVVISHYSNPLDDFYVVYADYALYKFHNSDEDAEMIMDNVIIPACDAAMTDYRLKMQHLKDMGVLHREMKAIMDACASKSDLESVFGTVED